MKEKKAKEPLFAGMLSIFFMGLGHIYAGRKNIGLIIIAVYIGLILFFLSWMIHPMADLSFLIILSGKEKIFLV